MFVKEHVDRKTCLPLPNCESMFMWRGPLCFCLYMGHSVTVWLKTCVEHTPTHSSHGPVKYEQIGCVGDFLHRLKPSAWGQTYWVSEFSWEMSSQKDAIVSVNSRPKPGSQHQCVVRTVCTGTQSPSKSSLYVRFVKKNHPKKPPSAIKLCDHMSPYVLQREQKWKQMLSVNVYIFFMCPEHVLCPD